MSAFIVSDAHINYLLTFMNAANSSVYIGDRRYTCDRTDNLDLIANKLRAANYASVNYRYNEQDQPEETGFAFHRCGRKADPLVVLKACACFDYQACEVPDYDKSEAAEIIGCIRKAAINRLPGYEDAKGWSIDE